MLKSQALFGVFRRVHRRNQVSRFGERPGDRQRGQGDRPRRSDGGPAHSDRKPASGGRATGAERAAGYPRRDDKNNPSSPDWPKRDQRGASSGGERREYKPRDDRPRYDKPRGASGASSGGGYPRRDDRAGSGSGERREYKPRDDRGGEKREYKPRTESGSGGYPRRDDRAGSGERREFKPRDDRPRYDKARDDRGGSTYRKDDAPRSGGYQRTGGTGSSGSSYKRDDRSGGAGRSGPDFRSRTSGTHQRDNRDGRPDFRPRVTGGGSSFKRDDRSGGGSGERREYKPRTEGGSSYPRRDERGGISSNGNSRYRSTDDKPRYDKPRDDRSSGGDRRDFKPRTGSGGYQRDDKPRYERPASGGERREYQPREDRGGERREYKPREDSGPRREDSAGSRYQYRDDKSVGGERREYKPRDDRGEKREYKPRTEGGYPRRDDRAGSGERREYKPRDDRGPSSSSRDDKPRYERPAGNDRPSREDRPRHEKPRHTKAPRADVPRDDPGKDEKREERSRQRAARFQERTPQYGSGEAAVEAETPEVAVDADVVAETPAQESAPAARETEGGYERARAPELPPEADISALDPEIKGELRGLPKGLAEIVGRHLAAAGLLVDSNPVLALEHARYARGKAARIGVIREAAGLTAYHAGEWAEALSELRAARRMSTGTGHIAVMADCERALGRPERALELAREVQGQPLSPDEAVELRIVAAGARRDMGQFDAAVVALQGEDLDPKRRDPWSARLFYAYADNLEAAGRSEESVQWFLHAAEADDENETDAAERAFGYTLVEEDVEDVVDDKENAEQ